MRLREDSGGMSRSLFAATPAAGHVNPALPIVRALLDAGHQVTVTTGASFEAAVTGAGARFAPLPAEASIDAATLDERYPDWTGASGPASTCSCRRRDSTTRAPTCRRWCTRSACRHRRCRPAGPAAVVGRPAGRRVVVVTQGTVATDPGQLLRPALAGLAGSDVLVVALTGGADPAVLGPLPANARAAAYVPYGPLLERAAAAVTNGGFGGVQLALAAGLPMVVAGKTEDKAEVAARVAWSGIGLDLPTQQPSSAALAAAVRQVLATPAFAPVPRAGRPGAVGRGAGAGGGAARTADPHRRSGAPARRRTGRRRRAAALRPTARAGDTS